MVAGGPECLHAVPPGVALVLLFGHVPTAIADYHNVIYYREPGTLYVAIKLDDIRWRQGSLRIHQRKTSSPLELPLSNECSSAIVKQLKRTPPQTPHRRSF